MIPVDLKSLVGKLNPTCQGALEAAAKLAVLRTHYNIEIEHWLLNLLEASDSDVAALLRQYEINASRLAADLTRVLERLKTGNTRQPGLSPNLVTLMREAWAVASLSYNAPLIRSGHLLYAMLGDENLAPVAREASSQFRAIPTEALRRDFATVIAATAEAAGVIAATGMAAELSPANGASTGVSASTGSGSHPVLDLYTVDLTERARRGDIDPVIGRGAEIRQVIDILTRRRQNNPILTGEAGVGKTAVVEGFALRIATGDVPPPLQKVSVRTLDLGLLQAGAGIKGEFESRLKSVIQEVKSSIQPIILFIDEAHTMIGAGGQPGQTDAANLLKPPLARGELRTIAATTWAEYKKYFEKDAALARRFQVIKVDEPTESVAVDMIHGLAAILENHHQVRILDEAVVEAVRLSHRYIPARQLPDKAVSLLDTTCARVAMSQTALPATLEDHQRRLRLLDTELGILRREAAVSAEHAERIADLEVRRLAIDTELTALETQWQQERELVASIRDLGRKLEDAVLAPGDGPVAEITSLRGELGELTARLRQVQGEKPLVQSCVDGEAVADVVATWTGIPVKRMVTNEIRAVLTLKERMEERIVGQSHALTAIAESIQTSRAGLTDPRKPIGVFLMVGPSGVGKTETALTLAELLYGAEQQLTVLNMSEFKEEFKMSMLVGSPPGYVGYGEGGVLTEAVRRRPYSVVLLDEMEKCHPAVQDMFYQVFDKGMLRDGEGRDIDFRNTVIIMTSNAGSETITKLCADPETRPDAARLAEALRPELLKQFKPAFLGRVSLVPYFPLTDAVLRRIVRLQVDRVARRVEDNYQAQFTYTPELVDAITARCREVESGARNIDHILNHDLLPELSRSLLARMAEEQEVKTIRVSVDENDSFNYLFQ